jgi:NAD(P) transhydrogenase subunit alpha
MGFVENLTLFVLAGFVGYEVITKIPATLHTPLIAGANAISGITLIGSVLVAGAGQTRLATALGFLAVVMATVNVVGGYLVSHRMLANFARKRGD